MKEITGDITSITSGIILHQVNCQNSMSSGVARALYEKHPIIKEEYHKKCKGVYPDKLLGDIQSVIINDDLIVVNSFTQLRYGNSKKTGIKYTDEERLINSIRYVELKAKEFGVQAYVPKYIGCGLAGGDWKIIEDALKETDIIVVGLSKVS